MNCLDCLMIFIAILIMVFISMRFCQARFRGGDMSKGQHWERLTDGSYKFGGSSFCDVICTHITIHPPDSRRQEMTHLSVPLLNDNEHQLYKNSTGKPIGTYVSVDDTINKGMPNYRSSVDEAKKILLDIDNIYAGWGHYSSQVMCFSEDRGGDVYLNNKLKWCGIQDILTDLRKQMNKIVADAGTTREHGFARFVQTPLPSSTPTTSSAQGMQSASHTVSTKPPPSAADIEAWKTAGWKREELEEQKIVDNLSRSHTTATSSPNKWTREKVAAQRQPPTI